MSELTAFAFESAAVRTVVINGEPWFVAKDVCAAIGITWKGSDSTGPLRELDDDEKGMQNLHTLGGEQQLLEINESGLYAAILKSRQRSAERRAKIAATKAAKRAAQENGEHHV